MNKDGCSAAGFVFMHLHLNMTVVWNLWNFFGFLMAIWSKRMCYVAPKLSIIENIYCIFSCCFPSIITRLSFQFYNFISIYFLLRQETTFLKILGIKFFNFYHFSNNLSTSFKHSFKLFFLLKELVFLTWSQWCIH